MGLLNFKSRPNKEPSKDSSGKIFSSDVKKKSAGEFGEAVVRGKKIKSAELKERVVELARGGKSAAVIEKELKKMGLRDSHVGKRKKIMSVISGSNEKSERKKPPIRKSVYQPINPETGRFSREGQLGEKSDTRINPLSGGTIRNSVNRSGSRKKRGGPYSSSAAGSLSSPPGKSSPPPRIPLAG